jgi:hypothetical protein
MAGLDRRCIPPLKPQAIAPIRAVVTLGLLLCAAPCRANPAEISRDGSPGTPSFEDLWGLLRTPDRASPPGLHKLLFEPTARGREAVLAEIFALSSHSPQTKLELVRAAYPWLSKMIDDEMTVAVIQLFQADPADGSPLALFARETAAMALVRSRSSLGPSLLTATLSDKRRTELEREAAAQALRSALRGPSFAVPNDVEPERSTVPTKIRQNPLRTPLAELEQDFLEGEVWLGAILAERWPFSANLCMRPGERNPRLARMLAWLSDESVVLRLSAAGGLGRKLSQMGASLEQALIMNELGARYDVEPSPQVRRALVIAIGRARLLDSLARRKLELARDLDPDPIVRDLTTLALSSPEQLLARPRAATVPAEAQPVRGRPEKSPDQLELAMDGTPCFPETNCQILQSPRTGATPRKP